MVSTIYRQILSKHPLCWLKDVQKGIQNTGLVTKTAQTSMKEVWYPCCSAAASVNWKPLPNIPQRNADRSQVSSEGSLSAGKWWLGERNMQKVDWRDILKAELRGYIFDALRNTKQLWGALVCDWEPLKIPQKLMRYEDIHFGEGDVKKT